MRNVRAIIRPAMAVLLLVLLTGCLPPQPPELPTPLPSSTPVFASEEEALAAAVAAYGAYVQVSDQIFMEGGAKPERMEAVATGDFLTSATQGFIEISASGLHSTGGTTFRNAEIQGYFPESGALNVISIYVCEDISIVDVVDTQGQSIVSASRPPTTIFQAAFDLGPSGVLLISSREVWSNESC